MSFTWIAACVILVATANGRHSIDQLLQPIETDVNETQLEPPVENTTALPEWSLNATDWYDENTTFDQIINTTLGYDDMFSEGMTEEEWEFYNPGIKGRITQKGLDYARDVALTEMMETLSDLHIPDIEQEIAGIDVFMRNIYMVHFPTPTMDIYPIPGIGLRWSGSDIQPIIEAEYEAVLAIGFFRIVKTGYVRMTGMNLSFELDFFIGRTFDGKPDISVYNCDARGLIFLNFEGGWSDTLNFGATIGQDNIRNIILAQICANARQEIEKASALAMQEFPVTHIFHDVFELDFRFAKFPAFYEEALETFHKGEIAYLNNGTRDTPPFPPPEMPTFHNDTSKMAYLYISDYLLNSGLYAAYRSGLLSYNISRDNIPPEAQGYLATSCSLSLCLGTIFPQLAEEYPNGEAALQVYASSIPQVEFLDGQVAVWASANAEVHIDTVEGSAHILTIAVNVTGSFEVAIEDQRVVFRLNSINPEAVIIENALETEGATLGFFFDTIIRVATQQFVVPKLTELGNEGFVIPEMEEVEFVEPEVFVFEDVLVISSDVQFNTSTF